MAKTLAELERELQLARESYEARREEEREAMRETTVARNAYNNIQHEIDKYMAELRKDAPAGDWKNDYGRSA